MEIFYFLGAMALVFLNGFFVATEFAIVKVRPTRIAELLQAKRPGAEGARKIIGNIDAYLGACQLGITLASLGLGWLGKRAFEPQLGPLLDAIGIVSPTVRETALGAGIFIIITFLHIVIGELAPKTVAILRPESTALAVSWPMRLFFMMFYPINWLLNGTANFIVNLTGIRNNSGHAQEHSMEEIGIILRQARSAGLLSASRSELLQKAMGLGNKLVKHLMVPRNEVVQMDTRLDFDTNLERALESGHTRFPLCQGDLDEVIGVVDIRDVLERARSESEVDIEALAKPLPFFPEIMTSERLLNRLREDHIPMAVVVDEYGGAAGIITPADVVSAVLGEIADEDDDHEMVRLPSGIYEVDGTGSLEELEATLKVAFPTQDMRTVAGFLMEKLGRMPVAGDRVSASGYVLEVTQVRGPRVKCVRIHRDLSQDK